MRFEELLIVATRVSLRLMVLFYWEYLLVLVGVVFVSVFSWVLRLFQCVVVLSWVPSWWSVVAIVD